MQPSPGMHPQYGPSSQNLQRKSLNMTGSVPQKHMLKQGGPAFNQSMDAGINNYNLSMTQLGLNKENSH